MKQAKYEKKLSKALITDPELDVKELIYQFSLKELGPGFIEEARAAIKTADRDKSRLVDLFSLREGPEAMVNHMPLNVIQTRLGCSREQALYDCMRLVSRDLLVRTTGFCFTCPTNYNEEYPYLIDGLELAAEAFLPDAKATGWVRAGEAFKTLNTPENYLARVNIRNGLRKISPESLQTLSDIVMGLQEGELSLDKNDPLIWAPFALVASGIADVAFEGGQLIITRGPSYEAALQGTDSEGLMYDNNQALDDMEEEFENLVISPKDLIETLDAFDERLLAAEQLAERVFALEQAVCGVPDQPEADSSFELGIEELVQKILANGESYLPKSKDKNNLDTRTRALKGMLANALRDIENDTEFFNADRLVAEVLSPRTGGPEVSSEAILRELKALTKSS